MNWAKSGPKPYSSFTSLNNGGRNERERLCKTYPETVRRTQQNAETLNPQIELTPSLTVFDGNIPSENPAQCVPQTPQSPRMLLQWRKCRKQCSNFAEEEIAFVPRSVNGSHTGSNFSRKICTFVQKHWSSNNGNSP